MDSIVKIVIALKLKFLLIVLSIGTSYFLEYKQKDQADPVSTIELVKRDTILRESGDSARTLTQNPDNKTCVGLGSGDHSHLQPVNFVANRPCWYQGLEIYIVL